MKSQERKEESRMHQLMKILLAQIKDASRTRKGSNEASMNIQYVSLSLSLSSLLYFNHDILAKT